MFLTKIDKIAPKFRKGARKSDYERQNMYPFITSWKINKIAPKLMEKLHDPNYILTQLQHVKGMFFTMYFTKFQSCNGNFDVLYNVFYNVFYNVASSATL